MEAASELVISPVTPALVQRAVSGVAAEILPAPESYFATVRGAHLRFPRLSLVAKCLAIPRRRVLLDCAGQSKARAESSAIQ
jgi:hypothetical protein